MFVVFLKFSANKDRAGAFMDGHNAWLKRGFDDGVFVLAGSLQPRLGGGILAHGTSRAELEARVSEDPFVAEGIVSAEIVELAPAKVDPRLDFLAV
ncbi:YciI family protein [Pelagibacterium halotolerans]|uniref:YciI family protein n=1 Tax=Pelagibacterium halotolerans TaxID=531813 RepID=UPI00384B157A